MKIDTKLTKNEDSFIGSFPMFAANLTLFRGGGGGGRGSETVLAGAESLAENPKHKIGYIPSDNKRFRGCLLIFVC